MSGRVDEKNTALYRGQLVDELDQNIALIDINTLVVTLYDAITGTIINGRDDQNIKNQNGCVISSTGGITWTLTPLDNIIIDPTLDTELHIALFEGTHGAGKEIHHQFAYRVKNLNKVS